MPRRTKTPANWPVGMKRGSDGRLLWTRMQGGRQLRPVYLPTKERQAIAEARRLNAKFDAGRMAARGIDMTVGQGLDRWLELRVAVNRNTKNARDTKARVENHIRPCVGDVPLDKLDADHSFILRQYLDRKGTLAPQTVHNILADFRSATHYFHKKRWTRHWEFDPDALPRLVEQKPRRLTDAELQAVLSVEDPYGYACWFYYLTALRWAQGLKAQVSDVEDGALVLSGDTAKNRRVTAVELPSYFLETLEGRVGPIIYFENPADYKSPNFNRKVARRSGVAGFHVHRLRHTIASDLGDRGLEDFEVQELLHHGDAKTTARYTRRDPHGVRQRIRAALESEDFSTRFSTRRMLG